MRRITGIAVTALVTTMVTATTPSLALAADAIVPTAVDLAMDGGRPNDWALGGTSLSGDGQYAAFTSFASNLVNDDRNGKADVFVRNTSTGTTTLVSVGSSGEQGDAPSTDPSISADGRYVTFMSNATNLVPGDTNEAHDVFVRDLQAGTTTMVSVTGSGVGAGWRDDSYYPSISGDGRYVAFETEARLTPTDTDRLIDVYVYDRVTGTPERVTVTPSGQPADRNTYLAGTRISGDGRFVVFGSEAANLVAGDTNGTKDVFVRDRREDVTRLVSATAAGVQGNGTSEEPAISADGRLAAFRSAATNLGEGAAGGQVHPTAKVYVKDLRTGELTREDRNTAGAFVGAWEPQLSGDGRYLAVTAFSGWMEGAWSGGQNVYVRDRQTGVVTPASHGPTGKPAPRACLDLALSADGRHVAFISDDGTLVAGDTDRRDNVFLTNVPN
ncbi:TolB family protein [Actinoplanes sp. NPDC049668]|uniref:TolB family protein n=1 Tax=unclassified Actinoplanes TaxID=2626549 RepID=UPI0033AC737B